MWGMNIFSQDNGLHTDKRVDKHIQIENDS